MHVLILMLVSAQASSQQRGWTIVARPDPRYDLSTLCFIDVLHGWCGGALTIYRTTDGGVSWKGGMQPYPAASIFSISFIDTLHGWAGISPDNSGGTVWRTTDGGLSWVERAPYRANRKYRATVGLSATKNLTVGQTFDLHPDTGKILQTFDGGLTWNEWTLADSLERLEHIQFVDSLHGWISGASLTGVVGIARTSDGGAYWQISRPPDYFQAIYFHDSLYGWAAGGSVVYRTSDGGSTWERLASVTDTLWGQLNIRSLSFQDSLHGRAFGSIPYYGIITEGIFQTNDGGRTWLRESIALTGDFGGVNDAQMLDADHGWAVCNDGSVLKYGVITSVGDLPDRAQKYWLAQNFPNPFNPSTTIGYSLPHRSHVTLKVFNNLGQQVALLQDGEIDAGFHTVQFDGSNLVTGVYFYRLQAAGYTETRKFVLMR